MDKKDYYTEEEVKAMVKDWKSFCDWMYGQAGPIVDGKFCYFTWDVERYIRNGQRQHSNKDSSAMS